MDQIGLAHGGRSVPDALNQRSVPWRIASPLSAGGTQTVSALVHESIYGRHSGDTTTVEDLYDANVAIFFKRSQEPTGMLHMIGPQNWTVRAIVMI